MKEQIISEITRQMLPYLDSKYIRTGVNVMSNFEFLKKTKEYALFAPAAIEAERVYTSAPAMCAVGCRKALELAVKWVYSADTTMQMPYKDNLQSLIHEPSFRFAVDYNT